MQVENLEAVNSFLKIITTFLGVIAGVIGAFFNQSMIKAEAKRQRDQIPPSDTWRRLVMWFKMHTMAWGIFIISSILIIPVSLLQNWVDGEIEDERENRQAKRDSALQATYSLQTKEITGNMSKMWADGLRRGEYNTGKIISNTDSNTQSLSGKMDSVKTKTRANITYNRESTKHIQKNDTLFLLPCLSNVGTGDAKNIYFNAYFLYSSKNQIYEYWKPFYDASGIELSKNSGACSTPEDAYIPNYHFDSSNGLQFMLFIGTYTDEDNISGKKEIKFAYKWDAVLMTWVMASRVDAIVNAHNDKKNINYF